MKIKPIISVITPSFNQGKYISFAIESILTQEGDFDIEYIIVDGCSIDESVDVIRTYEKALHAGQIMRKTGRITFKWICEPDKGQADALAKGFRMAVGDILCWLNSDDSFYPKAFQEVISHFEKFEDCGCVYGRAMYTTEFGQDITEYPTQNFDVQELPFRNFICQPATFFRRSVYQAVGGVNPSLRFSMDYDLWIRMSQETRFCFLPTLLATYRLHTCSKTVSPFDSVGNHLEGLATTVRHFGWAPISKVYGYCSVVALYNLPSPFNKIKIIRGGVAAVHCLFKYLSLNKGVRLNDIRLLTIQNLWKFLSGWEDVPAKITKQTAVITNNDRV